MGFGISQVTHFVIHTFVSGGCNAKNPELEVREANVEHHVPLTSWVAWDNVDSCECQLRPL